MNFTEKLQQQEQGSGRRSNITEVETTIVMADSTPVEVNGGMQWVLGEEEEAAADRGEKDDIFPANVNNLNNLPPAAPSDGQGGYTLTAQQLLLEKRKRLK